MSLKLSLQRELLTQIPKFGNPKKPRLSWILVVVLENPDRFAIRLTEQISCRTSVSLRSRNPNAPRTSTTTRTRRTTPQIRNLGLRRRSCWHSRSYPDRQSLYSGTSLPVLVSISFPWFTPLTAIRCPATLFTTEAFPRTTTCCDASSAIGRF